MSVGVEPGPEHGIVPPLPFSKLPGKINPNVINNAVMKNDQKVAITRLL
jgi:hypothetical protein